MNDFDWRMNAQLQTALDECARLRAENAELLAALKSTVSELEDCCLEEIGEPFCDPEISALIARVEGDV